MAKAQAEDLSDLAPGLYIVSTPIGNLRDITLRALDVLNSVDLILAEDTRTSQKLLNAYGLRAELRPYHDHNAAKLRPLILEELRDGKRIALISDAGTPLISDPGFKLVRDAAEDDLLVVPIPGVTAPIAALSVSGLPSDQFLFHGFLPPKTASRRAVLDKLKNVPATLIFFETGPRIGSTLEDVRQSLGDRDCVVARELTKLYEDVVRGTASTLSERYTATPPKGEIVLLVSGVGESSASSDEDIDAAMSEALEKFRTKDAANLIAEQFGIPKKEAYARALKLAELIK